MIERSVWPRCVKYLARKEILLIIGARQTGKTTLLKALESFLTREGKQAVSISLENPLILADLDENPENIFRYVKKDADPKYLLIDEVQYLRNPSGFLKYLYDTYGDVLKLVVTGSSAFYIDRSFKDSLAGRKRIVELYPFSFSEFLSAKEESGLSGSISNGSWCVTALKRNLLVPEREKLLVYLRDYMMFGGYPGVVMEPDVEEKRNALRDLHDSFLKKDIQEAGVSSARKFYLLLRLVASDSGKLLNANELANTLGLSSDTVREYLHVMQKTFIISIVAPFYRNVRKELTKMPKAYLLDPGFRNTVLNDFRQPAERQDRGELLENLIYIALHTAGFERINFWRTQDRNEVDFIVDSRWALEVKWQRSLFKPSKYGKFIDAYPEIPLNPVCFQDDEYLDAMDVMH